ncbi:MAG: cyclic nucleotide-binding domain-containing protein [Pseudomonadota bacterium]
MKPSSVISEAVLPRTVARQHEAPCLSPAGRETPHAKQAGEAGREPCSQCPTRHVCIAAKLPAGRLTEIPAWFRVSGVFAPGDVLFRAGDPAVSQFHVRSGMFKTFVINAQGDEFVTGFHVAGDIIGCVAKAGRYVESAVALETATLCELNLTALQNDAGGGAFAVLQALVGQIAEQAQRRLAHQLALSQTSAQLRFAAFCVSYAERLVALNRCATYLPTPMSRTDLANYLGMTLESLSRLVSKLNCAGVIAAARDHIEVCQPRQLAAMARPASCE